jgi:hypothetical protein
LRIAYENNFPRPTQFWLHADFMHNGELYNVVEMVCHNIDVSGCWINFTEGDWVEL